MRQYIYTLSPVSNKMKRALDVPGVSYLVGAVPSGRVSEIMDEADVLLHVESTDKIKLETCRLSFSTKIVDYFYKGKCILAVGGQNASMKYLKDNDAALVIDDLSKLSEAMNSIAEKPELIYEYGEKAWDCGRRNHDIDVIQNMIYQDFLNVLNSEGY